MALSLAPDLVVGGKYRLLRQLGRGGMGEVWAAEQSITRKKVAMKFLLNQSANDAHNKKRFLREARAACAVSHPNVVQIHDVIEVDGGTPAMVMELCEGESLEAKLARDHKLTVEETVGVMLRVVSAVGTAHTHGVVHRDLKPENIFLVETPDGINIKVLDFGIAKIGATEDGGQTGALTATGTMLGTPFYMSPEQAFGEKRIDHRADIWSLGVVMYRCLSGQLPTRADNLGQILKIIMTRSIPKLAAVAPDVPVELCQLVDSMLSYAPNDRPSDLRDVKQVLESVLELGAAAPDFGPPKEDPPDERLSTTDSIVSLGGRAAVDPAVAETTPSSETRPFASAESKSGSGVATNKRRPIPTGVFALGVAAVLGIATTALVIARRDQQQTSSGPTTTVQAAASSPPSQTQPTVSATSVAVIAEPTDAAKTPGGVAGDVPKSNTVASSALTLTNKTTTVATVRTGTTSAKAPGTQETATTTTTQTASAKHHGIVTSFAPN